MSNFDFTKTESWALLENFRRVLEDCIFIHNSALPERFHDKVRSGRTIKRLNEICDQRDGVTEHKKVKAIKAANIERYSIQSADGGEIAYDGYRDENKQYKNEMTLISAMISGGLIDADELEEE
jgi:hypothetical protein